MMKPPFHWLLAGALATSALACGGDDDDDGGNEVDAGDDEDPDAMPPIDLTREGTIAITQNRLLNPILGETPVNGTTITLGWTDPTNDVAPVPGFESSQLACKLKIYDFGGGDTPPSAPDEGVLTVTGTNHGPFECAHDGAKYVCASADSVVSGAGQSADGVTVANGGMAGTLTFVFGEEIFTANALVGMHLVVDGFTDGPGGDSSAFNGFPMPVVGNASNAIVVANVLSYPGTNAIGATGASYSNTIGGGPIPGGFELFPAEGDVTVTKPQSDKVDAIDESLSPAGAGFALDNESSDPTAFPVNIADATELKFTCEGEGGTCGRAAEGIDVLTISGEASNGDISAVGPTSLGTGATTYATWQCSGFASTGVRLPIDAIQAILDINPTRVRMSIGHLSNAQIVANGGGSATNVLVGNLLTGFTTLVVE